MIKENVYKEMADEFGTSVGVAHVIGYKSKKEVIKEDGIVAYKETKDDLLINEIVLDSIYFEMYQELQREVFKIRQKGNKKLKELTIYRRAFKEIIEKDEETYTEFG